jgi:hypothetical protein
MTIRNLLPLLAVLLIACTAAPRERIGSAQQGLGGAGGSGGASGGSACASSFTDTLNNGTLASVVLAGPHAHPALVVEAASDCTWGGSCETLLYIVAGSGAYTAPSWVDAPLVDFPAFVSCVPAWMPWGGGVIEGRGQVDGGPGALPSVSVGDVVHFWKANGVAHQALVCGIDSTETFPTCAIPVAGSPGGTGNVMACSSTCDTAWSGGFRTECLCAAGVGYSACSGDTTAVCADFWDVDGSQSGTARSSWADVALSGAVRSPLFPGLRY